MGTVMYYLKAVKQLKKCADPDEAVRFIQNHSFDIDVLPNHLLDHSKVWVAALGKLTLVRILAQLKTMTRRGLLSDPESPVMKCLLHCLSNTQELKMSKLQPGLILTAMAGVSRKWTFPNKDSELESPHPTLSYALENMLNNSLDNVAKASGRVLVVIDSRKTLSSNMCWGTHGLPCSKAAAFIILGLRAGGATVEVYTRGLRGMCPIDLTKEETVQGLASRLLVSGAQLVEPLMVVNWARDQGKAADLVLMLTDSHTEVETKESFWKELDRYRRDVESCKETKFVYSVLGSKSLSNAVARENDCKMLDICGMDSNYLRILQAFLADCF